MMLDTKSTETVIFLHIHKTAGTTLHHIIDRQYPPEQDFFIRTTNDYQKFLTFDTEQRAQYRLIRGHMDFGIHELLPNSAVYFTVLRDPIERVISYYFHIKNTPQHYCYELANRWDLQTFLEQGVDKLMANAQTRMWANGRPDLGFGECTPDVLEDAKRNLQQYCAVVGLAEYFDETLLLLKDHFSWRNVFYVRKNVSVNRLRQHDLPQETLAVLKKFNQLDVAFYQFGRELFEKQIRQQGDKFPQRVKRFQFINRQVVGRLLPAYRLARSVVQKGY